jgi:acyl-coenzyme A thioesterase PaaI-like protein
VGVTAVSLLDGIIPDPWLATSATIPAGRCGPPGMANGGWVCGTVAGHLGDGPVEVTLRAPTPLETPLDMRAADDDATLSLGDRLLVSARRSPGEVQPPAPVSWEEARAAEARYVGHHTHPFPDCFVCGTARAPGDGLRIFSGPVAGATPDGPTGPASGAPGRVAAVFTPGPQHAGPHGRLTAAAVWAALDCPTAWANMGAGDVLLLGRLRAEIRGELRPGRSYLVVAESCGVEGRKAYARAGLYDGDAGRLLAASEATWLRMADGV